MDYANISMILHIEVYKICEILKWTIKTKFLFFRKLNIIIIMDTLIGLLISEINN